MSSVDFGAINALIVNNNDTEDNGDSGSQQSHQIK